MYYYTPCMSRLSVQTKWGALRSGNDASYRDEDAFVEVARALIFTSILGDSSAPQSVLVDVAAPLPWNTRTSGIPGKGLGTVEDV